MMIISRLKRREMVEDIVNKNYRGVIKWEQLEKEVQV